MTKLKRVLIMAGGTGGHIFPGLAVAKNLLQHGVDVQWLGTQQGLEARIVPEANIPLHFITIGGVRGKNLKTLLLAPFKVISAVWQSVGIIRKMNPDVIIGMGGFASGPGGIAAWLCRKPLIIHEQNAKAGLTNKVLALFAQRVLEGFPKTFPKHHKVVYVGNPVRTEIASIPNPDSRFERPFSPFRLLVIGGSLGAQALNEIVPKAMALLPSDSRPLIRHQAGDKHIEMAKKHYESSQIVVDLQPFIKDIENAYAWADVVLCRAGASTVAELCAAGLGAIFIPFPHAVDDHQTANAAFMVKNNAAICIQQAELTEMKLAGIIKELMSSPEKRLAMAKNAFALRKPDSVIRIVEICQEVCP